VGDNRYASLVLEPLPVPASSSTHGPKVYGQRGQVHPTHVAVALRYEPGSGQAPRILAKGADHLAARIREEARRHGVPVVEDPPLARALHAACDLDDLVPVELYLAVARLLAFVFTLPDLVRRSGRVHRRPVSAMVA
jgi:type III secretion system FlhB-like substrate exporter